MNWTVDDRVAFIGKIIIIDYLFSIKPRVKMLAVNYLSAFAAALSLAGAQSFNPNQGSNPNSWDPSQVGTNLTTNATYNNPIMTVNAGDP